MKNLISGVKLRQNFMSYTCKKFQVQNSKCKLSYYDKEQSRKVGLKSIQRRRY